MKKILTYMTLSLALAASCNKAELDQNTGTGILCMDMKLSEQTKAMTSGRSPRKCCRQDLQGRFQRSRALIHLLHNAESFLSGSRYISR